MTTSRSSDRERRNAYAKIAEGVDTTGDPRIAFVRRAEMRAPKRLGALAASFNPPTKAHLKMAEIAHAQGCGQVLMELAKANVDKKTEHAPLHERLMMLNLTAQERRWMSIGVGSHGRFIDKSAALKKLYPASEIVFIVGYDTFIRVFDDKYYEDRDAELDALFAGASFLCANRKLDGIDSVEALLNRPEKQALSRRRSNDTPPAAACRHVLHLGEREDRGPARGGGAVERLRWKRISAERSFTGSVRRAGAGR